MKKLIVLAVLAVMFLAMTACQRSANQNAATNSVDAQKTVGDEQTKAQEMEVTIYFSGLMVLNKKTNGDYEMGILSDDPEDHIFCVKRASASRPICRDRVPAVKEWEFIITNPTATPAPTPLGAASPRPKRRPDNNAEQFDFNWTIELDGPEFHNRPLELESGHLNPIIQLPKGVFFTKYKSYDFVRTKGGKPDPAADAFGFVAETTGLRLILRPGQELVLRAKGGREPILSIPYLPPHVPGGNYEIVLITNVRTDESEYSDFHMYYALFPKVPENERYDFHRNYGEYPCPDKPSDEGCIPLNLVPRDKRAKDGKRTCCQMDCTKIYLTRLGKALE